MTNRMTVSFEGDHIPAESYGEKSLARSKKLFAAIVDACEANNCYRVLRIAESTVFF